MSNTSIQERESIAKEILTAVSTVGGSEGASVDDIKKHLTSNLENVPDAENIEWCLNDAVEKGLLTKLPNGNYKLKDSKNLTQQAGQTIVSGLNYLSEGVAKIANLSRSGEKAAQEKEKKEETEKDSDDKKPSSDDLKTSSDDKKPSSDDLKTSSDAKKSSDAKETPPDVKKSASNAKTSSSDAKETPSDVKKSASNAKKSSSDAKKSFSDDKKTSSDDKKTSSDDKKKKFCGIL